MMSLVFGRVHLASCLHFVCVQKRLFDQSDLKQVNLDEPWATEKALWLSGCEFGIREENKSICLERERGSHY
jgi:hypothetical protein